MKKIFFFFSILMLSAALSQAQVNVQVRLPRISAEVIMGSRQPNRTEAAAMRAEENAHPNITEAMRNCQAAMDALHNAPDQFGGHKARAESDLRQAWISLRKALYYRLYQDR